MWFIQYKMTWNDDTHSTLLVQRGRSSAAARGVGGAGLTHPKNPKNVLKGMCSSTTNFQGVDQPRALLSTRGEPDWVNLHTPSPRESREAQCSSSWSSRRHPAVRLGRPTGGGKKNASESISGFVKIKENMTPPLVVALFSLISPHTV